MGKPACRWEEIPVGIHKSKCGTSGYMPQKMIQSIYHFHSKEGNNMNKIYKVIWSKAKHTYVVASEIAKGHTKGETTGKGLKKLAAAMLVAAALLSPSFAWAADATVKVEPAATGSTTAVEVYTKEETEKEISTLSTQIGNNATNINTNTTNINGLTTKVNALETADKNSVTEVTGSDAKLTIKKGDGSTSEVTIDNVNHAASADSATKAIQDGDGNVISTTYAKLDENGKVAKAVAADSATTAESATKATQDGDGNVISTTYAKLDENGKVAKAVAADSATTADSATKATQDGNGNEISTTYATKTELSTEVTNLQAADSALDSRTSALEAKTGSLNRVAAAHSTSINESMTLKGNQYSATLQVNGSGAQIGVVNNSDAGLANDGGTAYTEYRAGTGEILSKATNDISSTSSNGQVVDTAGNTAGEYSRVATAKSIGTTFTYSKDGEKNSSSTTIKGNSVSTGTVSATAGITDGTTTDGTSVKASQTVGQNLNALDDRITNVKEYVLSETVSKTDAAVQDGAIVKAANTIGENVTNLDAALAKETAARIGADKAQDKVIEQVNQNMVKGFNTINKNMFDGFTALNNADLKEAQERAAADAAETAGRLAADAKLVEATNGGLSLSKDNVLQKNTTTIDAQGNVTTSKTDAKEMILNKGNDNQITLNEKGIKVGTNSSVMDANGVYTGGDNYTAAKAAMSADGSIKGASGDFTVDGTNGNVNTKGSVSAASGTIGNVSMSADGTVTGVKDLTASGKVTAGSFTDGTATMSNGSLNGVNQINATGNIVTTGNMKAHDITAEGTIKGETIYGTTGTFGSLTTTSNASVGGKLTANGITNTGNVITDTLTVNHNATVGGDLGVTGDITGKSLNVGTGDIKGGQITGTGLDVGAGTIKTTGAVETGTLTTTGDAAIGGNLTVDKNLTVNGEFNAKTLSSKLDENNYTTINGGKTESVNLKVDTKTRETQSSASTFDETGSNAWAKDDDSIGTSSMTADKISQSLSDTGDHPKNIASRELSQNTDNKYEIMDSVVDEDGNTNTSTQTASESSSVVSGKDGKNTYKSYITQNLKQILQKIEDGDGNPLTSVEQTEKDITNTAKNGTITNDADKVLNQGATSVTSQIGDGTAVKSELTANGITNTAVGGTITNSAKDLVNTASENMTNTVGKDLTTTVGGNQTTTVTGDSSLTAENINNTAKNKITNKALDVETEASSSIVNKVSNDAGSNTSTQLYNQTTEEMSADGKTASYLRGAVEEKSQLTDGDKKTTIDTIAGQTNTNITDGKNISNNLQKADKIASSVTDGKSTTVVDQKAGSLASSITDGTKVNNTSSTVDKSEQLIKASDTQYSATKKTATKTEDALVNGSSVIDVIKSLDDAANPVISSAVTDGTNTTGSTMTAKGITNSAAESIVNEIGDGSKVKSEMTAKGITNTAKDGTITNDAKDVLNKGTNSVINEVGNNQVAVTTGSVKAAYGSDTSTTWDANGITSATSGDMKNSATNITNSATEKLSNSAVDIENKASNSILNQVGKNTSWRMTDGTVLESINGAGGQTNTITDTADSTVQNVKNGKNELTSTTSSTNADLTINNGSSVYTKVNTATGNKETVAEGDTLASTNLTKDGFNVYAQDENGHNTIINNASGTTQTIQTDDKHLNVTTKTVGSSDEKLTSGSSVIDVLKSFDDEGNPAATSTVTDGTNTSEVKQTAKDITNTAKNGTITNDAKDLVNTASNSITDKVGENVERTMGTKKITESVKDGTKSNIFTKTADKDINIVTDGTSTSTLSQLAGSVNTSLKNGTQSLNNVKTVSEDTTKITDASNPDSKLFSSSSQKVDSITNTVKDGTNTSEVKQTASEVATSAKDISNTATDKITSQIGDGSKVKSEMTADGIANTATKITNITGNNTVTSDTKGTTFENTAHSTAIEEGTVTKTTISGNTMETGLATMDYAEVMKDLGVRGNATVDGTSTLKGDVTMESNASVGKNLTVKGDTTMEGNASVGKDLTVAGTSTLTGDVTMENNATVKNNLTVEGETSLKNTSVDGTLDVTGKSTFNDTVSITKGGLEVAGGTTTDTLHVTSTATFDDIVTMKSNLNVGGNVDAASYKVDGKTYIDKDGINANNQVIKNVGQGDISEGSHDAVSGGQLYETNTRVSGLETRMGTVETKVDKLDNKIDKVGANAAAMANLHPLEFDEDSKWNIAAAVGSSGSETASAVGVFYRPNENVMVNASAAMGTGENMFGGGVSLRLGHGGNKAKEAQMKAAAKENRELRAKVDDLTARMDALLSVLNPNMSKDFPDVPENHWAYEAVSRLAGNGIVEGYEDGKYHGERQMTRYEMAEIIYNALSKGVKAEKKLVEEFRPELQAMAAQKKA